MSSFLYSRDGVAQEDLLAMVSYGLGVLLIIKNLKTLHPGVMKLWYADDAGYLGTFGNIEYSFNDLKHVVMECEYYPKPKKA